MAVDPFECYRQKARSGKVTKQSLQEMQELRDLMESAGNDPMQIAQAQRVLDAMKRKVEVRRIQTGLQFMAYQRAISVMDSVQTARRSVLGRQVAGNDAAASLLARDHKGVFIGHANVETLTETIRGQAHARFIGALEALRRKGLGLIDGQREKTLSRDILRALYGDTSVSKEAKAYADAWRDTDHYLIQEMRRGGADIVERQDFRIPQKHDPTQFRRAAGNVAEPEAHLRKWKEDILPKLDRERMLSRVTGKPLTDDELDGLLDEMFDSVYSDGLNRFEKAQVGAGTRTKRPRRLADRHTMERFIVFKNADAQIEYNRMYGGDHDLFSIFTGHIDKRAREAAMMQVLGPDPDATFDLLSKRAQAIDQKKPASAEGIFNELMGRLESPDSEAWANGGRAVRNILTAAQLGGAFISAIADVSFQALTAGFNGMSFGRVFAAQMRNWIGGAYSTADTVFAARLGLVAEEWSGSALAAVRVMGDLNGPRATRKVADAVMRASLLSSWTQAGRHAFGTEMLGHLGDQVGKSWDEMVPATRAALERRGLTAAEWDEIRKVPLVARDETRPQARFMSVPDIIAAGHRAAALKIMQTVQEEIEFAVPGSSVRARANLKGAFGGGTGTQAGTIMGEITRSVAMYKSFPVTLAYTHLSRMLFDPAMGTKLNRATYGAKMFVATTVMGAMAYNSKAILAGKDPVDPFDTEEWERSVGFWSAAALQGGGLGLFGDFLLNDYSRYGKSLSISMAGPVASLVDDTYKLAKGTTGAFDEDSNYGRELNRFIRNYTPGSNLWYARLAWERMVMDELQAAMDPDAHAAWRGRINRAKRDFGQDYWWAPGRVLPERPPELTD